MLTELQGLASTVLGGVSMRLTSSSQVVAWSLLHLGVADVMH